MSGLDLWDYPPFLHIDLNLIVFVEHTNPQASSGPSRSVKVINEIPSDSIKMGTNHLHKETVNVPCLFLSHLLTLYLINVLN